MLKRTQFLKFPVFGLVCAGMIACSESRDTTPPSGEYRYDRNKLACFNGKGKKGMNESLIGECANLENANLSGKNLTYYNLRGANLRGANLKDTDLSYADLRAADFRGAKIDGTKMKGALYNQETKHQLTWELADLGLRSYSFEDADRELHSTAGYGSPEQVKNVLNLGADPNSQGGVAIESAIRGGRSENLRLLMSHGGRLLPSSASTAAASGSLDMLETVLGFGARADGEGSYEGKPLLSAVASYSSHAMSEELIKRGAKVRSEHVRASVDLKTLKLLVQSGGKIRDREMWSQSDKEVIEYMVSQGIGIDSPSAEGLTLLMTQASNSDYYDMVTWLISKGAKVNTKDKNGWTPLSHAVNSQQISNVKKIVGAGADLNDSFDKTGNPVLVHVAKSTGYGAHDFMKELIKLGADANAKNSEGRSAVFFVKLDDYYDTQALDTLLAAGADLNQKDNAGQSAANFLYANAGYTPNAAKKLLEKGAGGGDLRDNEGATPLIRYYKSRSACGSDYDNEIDSWLSKGVSVNASDSKGNTALHYVAIKANPSDCNYYGANYEASVVKLLEKGANPSAVNAEGDTHLHLILAGFKSSDRMMENIADAADSMIAKGLDVNLKNKAGKSLLEVAYESKRARVILALLKAKASDEAIPASAPVAKWTPTNACSGQVGWTAENGGCKSPVGQIWSVSSAIDNCVYDELTKSRTCVASEPKSVTDVADYCSRLWQGNRLDWRVPTYREFVHALASGYFGTSSGTMSLGEIQVQLPSGEVAPKESWSQPNYIAYCVAK